MRMKLNIGYSLPWHRIANMGNVEMKARKLRRLGYVQSAVLATVEIAGIIAITMIAPNIFQAFPRLMGKKRYQLAFQARTAVSRLVVRGFVRFVERKGKKFLEITDEGARALAIEQERTRLMSARKKRWDKRYRIVMFDISQRRKADRERVRAFIRECGFLRLQNSVWVFPYDCEELITLLKADMRIGKDVLYAVVETIENDGWIKKHFNLR
ncbi:MAG: CRISPR-associated endonuclease Cas2 [bacterium]|nr:CRISPR-associated endonuclease Cas2 [bacterium]